ncbi:hypothetical protein [Clostridioides difficile]|nr:hypothetical protein [Clostridioides difficile]
MNGYESMADSYRKLVGDGELDKEGAAKANLDDDLVATCNTDAL